MIEPVFDEDGHDVDFVFRYCNKHMAAVDGIPVEDMLNRSFYEVFKNGDIKSISAPNNFFRHSGLIIISILQSERLK